MWLILIDFPPYLMVRWIGYLTKKGNYIPDVVQALVKEEEDIVLIGVGCWMVPRAGAGEGDSIGVSRNANGGRRRHVEGFCERLKRLRVEATKSCC
jgi:hypothetical protein